MSRDLRSDVTVNLSRLRENGKIGKKVPSLYHRVILSVSQKTHYFCVAFASTSEVINRKMSLAFTENRIEL